MEQLNYEQPKSSFTLTATKWVLVVSIAIFTLGLVTMFDYIKDGLEGRN
jgi:hypothetical protein